MQVFSNKDENSGKAKPLCSGIAVHFKKIVKKNLEGFQKIQNIGKW